MKSLILIAASLLTGCASMYSVPHEPDFTPNPVDHPVKITFVQVQDVAAECRARFPKMLGSYLKMFGCAGWTADKTQCTVVVGTDAIPQVIGHEVRHCFEGSFHS